MTPKPEPMPADLLAQLRAKMTTLACPKCGAYAMTVQERYDPTRPEPPVSGLAYGPNGRPLWAWCGECGTHGRVAEVHR